THNLFTPDPIIYCEVIFRLFILTIHSTTWSPFFPYTTLFRSPDGGRDAPARRAGSGAATRAHGGAVPRLLGRGPRRGRSRRPARDRKSTRLNSSHVKISYAVFCLKKKKDSRRNILHT